MKHLCRSLGETEAVAALFLNNLEISKNGATVVGLIGDLGSGKTTFTQALARQLGVTEKVTSPTFVIQKRYDLDNQKFNNLIHIDAYRLGKAEELAHLKWAEIVADPGNLILVEWADRIISALPADVHKLMFRFVDNETREINF